MELEEAEVKEEKEIKPVLDLEDINTPGEVEAKTEEGEKTKEEKEKEEKSKGDDEFDLEALKEKDPEDLTDEEKTFLEDNEESKFDLKELQEKTPEDLTEEEKKFVEDNAPKFDLDELKEKDPKDLSDEEKTFIEAEEKEAKEEAEKGEAEVVDFESAVKERYGEKFEIETVEDLDDLIGDYKKLTEEVEELKKLDPKFDSDFHKKVFNFITTNLSESSEISEGFLSYARLMEMDVDNLEPRLALKEQFIMENPEISIDKAGTLFDRHYSKKYTVDESNFDLETEEGKRELKEEKEINEITEEKDSKNAKSWLRNKRKEFTPEAKKESKEEAEAKEATVKVIGESQEANKVEWKEAMTGFESLIFSDEKNPDEKFTYKLSKKQIGQVNDSINEYITQDSNYDDKGVLLGGFDAENLKIQTTFALFGHKIADEALKNGIAIGEAKKVKEASKLSPKREDAHGEEGEHEGETFMDSAEAIIKKREAKTPSPQ